MYIVCSHRQVTEHRRTRPVHRSIEGVHLSDDQRLDWLRLIRSDNVGACTFRSLVNHYVGAHRALAALPDLARRGGASGPARVCSRQDAERELTAARSLGVALVALGESDYPRRLMMIDDAPPLLAVRGSPAVFGLPLSPSSARAMHRRRASVSPSGWHAISARPASPSPQ